MPKQPLYFHQQIERRNKWIEVPFDTYDPTINDVHQLAAVMDAWRRFFQPSILKTLADAKADVGTPGHYGQHLTAEIHFPKGMAEPVATEWIHCLLQPLAPRIEPGAFKRYSLRDPRAVLEVPLGHIVAADRRVSPVIEFSIVKPLEVRLENFTFGKEQKAYKCHEVLLFHHPDLRGWTRTGGQPVANLEIEKGKPIAERREALFLDAESHTEEWKFTILERAVTRRLNGEPEPQDDQEIPW